MKKLSKKQQLIILISIITIIVIIGIIIGANIIRTNIANGNYNSSNGSSNNNNLLPEYIKAGITLGGVTGTLEDLDTSDATATAEDIALGKTAYVNGVKITGTYEAELPTLSSENIFFTQDIDYWTNQDVTVNVSSSLLDYTIQTTIDDPNEESSWNSTATQKLQENGTVYARITNGSKTSNYIGYEVDNIDKEPPDVIGMGRMTISTSKSASSYEPNVSRLVLNNVWDNDRRTGSGISKVVIYYKSDAQNTFSRSEDIVYTPMNGTERGEMVRNSVGLEFFAHFSTEDFEGHGIYMYADVYDVAGNVSTSYLAYMSADGKEFTYTPQ